MPSSTISYVIVRVLYLDFECLAKRIVQCQILCGTISPSVQMCATAISKKRCLVLSCPSLLILAIYILYIFASIFKVTRLPR